MDIVFIALTLIFFALTWGFMAVCDRLAAPGQGEASNKN